MTESPKRDFTQEASFSILETIAEFPEELPPAALVDRDCHAANNSRYTSPSDFETLKGYHDRLIEIRPEKDETFDMANVGEFLNLYRLAPEVLRFDGDENVLDEAYNIYPDQIENFHEQGYEISPNWFKDTLEDIIRETEQLMLQDQGYEREKETRLTRSYDQSYLPTIKEM